MIAAAALAAVLSVPARAAAEAPPEAQVAAAVDVLRRGNWNERIHAAYSLEAYGDTGLPGLREAALDADWQVRMTAAHLMGRVGLSAAPDLARVLKTDPCRHVRLTAVHWLGSMGPEADAVLSEALSSDNEMARGIGRYWQRKSAGKQFESTASDAPPPVAEFSFPSTCDSSASPGRAPWADAAEATPASQPAPPSVATPDPPATPPVVKKPAKTAARAPARAAIQKERLKELDELLADASPSRPPSPPRPADAASAPQPALAAPPDEPAERDPLPVLLVMLHDADARKRARAADELGKRGSAAVPALKDLSAALKDGDRRVRASAALALGNLGAAADSTVPALVSALRRGPEDVALSAAVALGRIDTPRSRRAFARYARQAAGELLKREPSPAK